MRESRFLSISLAAAVLVGCSSAQPPATGGNAALPNRALQGRNLLYASTEGDQPLSVYAYPGGKMVGSLSGPIGPRGLCADKRGDVFVPFVYIPGGVDEFAHDGGAPIAYLGFPYDWENGCSVSPATGALAVVTGPGALQAAAVVYRYRHPRGWGLERIYGISSMKTAAYCGFDSDGNLFVDGMSSSGSFVLAELPKGTRAFVTLSVSQRVSGAGQVQWDGKHLAIGDTGVSPSVVYQFVVSGSTATETGSTKLDGSTQVEQFWIRDATLVAPDPSRSCGTGEKGCIALYHYPAGGAAFKTIALSGALGATVSIAQ